MATNYLSNKAKYLLATKALDLATDTLKLVLVLGTYTPDPDNNFLDSITAYELDYAASGYIKGFGNAGRHAIASAAVTQVDASNLAKFTFATATWTALGPATGGATIAYALLAKEITDDAHSPIIATYDVGLTVNSGDVTLTPHANGAITIS